MWNNWFRKAIRAAAAAAKPFGGGRRRARPRRDHFSASLKRTKSTRAGAGTATGGKTVETTAALPSRPPARPRARRLSNVSEHRRQRCG